MLPFLKKLPRVNPDSHSLREQRMVNGSQSSVLEHHCAGEFMDAAKSKNVKSFRAALEALILNLFEDQEGAEHADVS